MGHLHPGGSASRGGIHPRVCIQRGLHPEIYIGGELDRLPQDTTGYGQQSGKMHRIGMHSSSRFKCYFLSDDETASIIRI